MTETWCALLNVLILSLVAGLNGVLIHRSGGLFNRRSSGESGSSEDR
jgi:hypothetical protein